MKLIVAALIICISLHATAKSVSIDGSASYTMYVDLTHQLVGGYDVISLVHRYYDPNDFFLSVDYLSYDNWPQNFVGYTVLPMISYHDIGYLDGKCASIDNAKIIAAVQDNKLMHDRYEPSAGRRERLAINRCYISHAENSPDALHYFDTTDIKTTPLWTFEVTKITFLDSPTKVHYPSSITIANPNRIR
jgi:hypothetical protein